MSDEWENHIEEDGITLGPEEALRREIEKSKALKVERLQLRNEVEDLRSQVRDLQEKNRVGENGADQKNLSGQVAESPQNQNPIEISSKQRLIPMSLVCFILVFNLAAIGLLLYLLLQK